LDKKSISDWFAITSQEGKVGWLNYYKGMLGQPISKPDKFFKALDDFGHVIMFESVVAASTRKLEGDPLNYVIAIAVSKVNDEVEAITAASKYAYNLERAKQRTVLQNEELDSKLRKALGVENVRVD
jgi:hypothetical protein